MSQLRVLANTSRANLSGQSSGDSIASQSKSVVSGRGGGRLLARPLGGVLDKGIGGAYPTHLPLPPPGRVVKEYGKDSG